MEQEQKQQQLMVNSLANQIANQGVRIAELESIIGVQQEEIKEYRQKEVEDKAKNNGKTSDKK
ncbi:hypothetical protein MKY30_23820 [Oceanobacillus sp. FSL W8-0428]|uniref:hypothetical protein n=1 Tax=Oceanobacillus sp. FSL W8-0428 TaxID=2921715 RepID=UPI0030FC8F4B